MPRYKAKERGYWGGMMHGPGTNHPVVHADKPFPKAKVADKVRGYNKGDEMVPSWMERTDDETTKQKLARLQREDDKVAADKERQTEDDKDVKSVNTPGDNDGVTNL